MATMSSFSYQYPMERVLYSLHHQICTAALRHTSFRARNRLEKTVLLVAVCAFGALWLAHVSLVHRGSSRSSIPITCLPSIEGFRVEADVAHLLLAPDGTGSAAWMLDKDDFVAEACQAPTGRILFSYSNIKGYLLLSKEIRQQRGLQVQYIAVAGDDVRCFGEPFLQTLVAHVGADTVMLNWLSAVYRTGFVYNPRTEEMMELVADSGEDDYRQQVLAKLAVVLKTSFLFFITTTLVSFTLRETQSRMLDFTHQLQAHVRAQRSVVQLVTQHLMENLVFVPIMVGMIFFLIEFYRGDKFLAFMVVTLVWLCEVFSVISLRSSQGIHFFPRIFFLLFSLFHFYLFSFPFGFSYMALASTVCFMTHSMLFFWHRYELPAFAHGLVSVEHPRMGLTPSPSSIPSLDSDSARQGRSHAQQPVPMVHLAPRHALPRNTSHNTMGSSQLSRPTSGLFHRSDDTDDGSSYLYLLNGEVVMHHRPHSPLAPQDASAHRDAGIPDRILAVSRQDSLEDFLDIDDGPDSPPIETSGLRAILQNTPRRHNLSTTEDEPLARTAPGIPGL